MIMDFFDRKYCNFLFSTIILLVQCLLIGCWAKEGPVFFIFGDSVADVGNNNYVNAAAKADFLPFGIDFGSPTGRFTNGRTVLDIVGEEVGITNYIPPYLAPTTVGEMILKGVNYASSASGILNATGTQFGDIINLDTQISYFEKTRKDIEGMTGGVEAEKLLRQAIYFIVIGSNDVLNKDLHYSDQKDTFFDNVISRLRLQLTRVYNLGGRKFVVSNAGPVGCIPFQKDYYPLETQDCVGFSNQNAQTYNHELQTMLHQLTLNLNGSMFVYANIYSIFHDILTNYVSYGFENANSACCRTAGLRGGLIPCNPAAIVCIDRTKYVFWDPFHLTENANIIAAKRLVDGDFNYILPINIRQLVEA